MTPTRIPHLCGGIFFGLLCEAKKTRRKAKNKLNGGSDGLTIPGIYAGLINVITGEDLSSCAGLTLKRCATNYRKCESSTGAYVPFTNSANQSAFAAQYKSKNPDLLNRMSRFIDTYLNEAKCEWLVRAIIEILQTERPNTVVALNDAEYITVAKLDNSKTISFLPFLLSVLYYVVTECPDCESGKPTFEAWYSQKSPRGEWKFNSNVGNGLSPMNVSINLTPHSSKDPAALPPYSDNTTQTNHQTINPSQNTIPEAAERIKHNDDAIPNAASTKGTVVHQTIVNQYGSHPIHIDHVENLSL